MRRAAALALPKVTSLDKRAVAVEALLAAAHNDVDAVVRHYATMALGDLDTPHCREELAGPLAAVGAGVEGLDGNA
jgi:hypothetical protein